MSNRQATPPPRSLPQDRAPAAGFAHPPRPAPPLAVQRRAQDRPSHAAPAVARRGGCGWRRSARSALHPLPEPAHEQGLGGHAPPDSARPRAAGRGEKPVTRALGAREDATPRRGGAPPGHRPPPAGAIRAAGTGGPGRAAPPASCSAPPPQRRAAGGPPRPWGRAGATGRSRARAVGRGRGRAAGRGRGIAAECAVLYLPGP